MKSNTKSNTSGLVDYAKSELALLGSDDDGMQDMINSQILDIVKMFAEQGHTGFTASYSLNILKRLLAYKPIKPLTGEVTEWTEPLGYINEDKQNIRCSSVFLKKDGTAWDVDAIRVSDDGGISWFSSGRFRKQVTFPYYPPDEPERVYIEYKEDVEPGYTSDDYDIITDDPERIKALREKKLKEREEYF